MPNPPFYLQLMIGPGVPVPVPRAVLEALTSVSVTSNTQGASVFQLSFTLSTKSPLHTLFLVPGGGPHPGLPGNYLHGAVFHVGNEATGSWVVLVHDCEDGASRYSNPKLPEALSKLEEILASAPFHLRELDALGFHMT